MAVGITTEPNETVDVDVNPVPVMVTIVPAWPVVGEMPSTVATTILCPLILSIKWLFSMVFENTKLVTRSERVSIENLNKLILFIICNIGLTEIWQYSFEQKYK